MGIAIEDCLPYYYYLTITMFSCNSRQLGWEGRSRVQPEWRKKALELPVHVRSSKSHELHCYSSIAFPPPSSPSAIHSKKTLSVAAVKTLLLTCNPPTHFTLSISQAISTEKTTHERFRMTRSKFEVIKCI